MQFCDYLHYKAFVSILTFWGFSNNLTDDSIVIDLSGRHLIIIPEFFKPKDGFLETDREFLSDKFYDNLIHIKITYCDLYYFKLEYSFTNDSIPDTLKNHLISCMDTFQQYLCGIIDGIEFVNGAIKLHKEEKYEIQED